MKHMAAALILGLASTPALARTYAAPIEADGGEIPYGGTWGRVRGAGTRAEPYSIADFLSSPPDDGELVLLDGTYRGASSMLRPQTGRGGSEKTPLYVHAERDGRVLIDGGTEHLPLRLRGSWWIVSGIDVRSQAAVTVSIGAPHTPRRTTDVILRRVVAYKDPIPCAADPCVLATDKPTYEAVTNENVHVLTVTNSDRVLVEDVAAFGRGRKTIEVYKSTHATLRRVWVRTEGNWPWIASSNLKAISCQYQSFDVICENILATVGGSPDTRLQPADYADTPQIATTDGETLPGASWIPPGRDRFAVGMRILGSIVYDLPSSRLVAKHGVRVGGAGSFPNKGMKRVTLDDLVVWLRADSRGARLSLQNCDDDPIRYPQGCSWSRGDDRREAPLVYDDVTLRGGRGRDIVKSDWRGGPNQDRAPQAELGLDIYTPGGPGASVCYRTVDGVVTTEKLWPWPMQDRIKKATAASLWETADVMADLRTIFSPVPAQCLNETP